MQNIADESEVDAFLGPPPQGEPAMNPSDMASPEEVDQFFKEDKYGSTGQQIITGIEGAANAATFGLSSGIERALGVNPEDIAARREVNPGSHMVGQVAGLVGSAFVPGVGAANILERAGVAGAKAIGLGAAEGALAKIGSTAVKAAVENSLFQSGDEVGKMLASDPDQSVETAVTNIGLSGLVGLGAGGAIGSVSPLWKATMGGKVGTVLDSIKTKAGGIDGTIDDAVHDAVQKIGVDLAPEIKAGLSNDPRLQTAFKTLQQSDTTKSGQALQKAYGDFNKQVNEVVLESFGKTEKDLPQEISKYQYGKQIGDTAAKEVEEKLGPIGKEFEKLESKYGNVELPKDLVQETSVIDPNDLTGTGTKTVKETVPGFASRTLEKIEQAAIDNKWNSFEDPEVAGLLNGVRKELPNKKTISELTSLISTVGEKANKNFANLELKRAGQIIKGVLQEEKDNLLISTLGKDAPELVDQFMATKSAWKDAAGLVGELRDRLGIKGSTSAFPRFLREMAQGDGEAVLRKLSGAGDADFLRLVQEQFPQTAQAIKDYHLTDVLKKAADKAKPGEAINSGQLLKSIEGMSPELREFAIPPEALAKARAVGTISEQFAKAPHNFSNTARTMDKLFEYIPATAVGMATLASGGNPLMAGILGTLTKAIGKDVPDAVKLALLKFMASGQPIEAGAFKATVDVIDATLKGQRAISTSTRALFKNTREVFPSKKDIVSEKDREKLDKQLMAYEKMPERLLEMGGETAYYMPEHSTAMAATTGRVMNYLRSVRPSVEKASPLDSEPTVNAVQKSAYNRALDLAESPLLIMQSIKDGNLITQDVVAVKTMYPALYNKLSQEITNQIIDRTAKDDPIPYKTKLSLSLFLGQPLDSTMKPESIVAAQPKNVPPQQGANGQAKGSMKNIDKLGKEYATPEQAREMQRLKRT